MDVTWSPKFANGKLFWEKTLHWFGFTIYSWWNS